MRATLPIVIQWSVILRTELEMSRNQIFVEHNKLWKVQNIVFLRIVVSQFLRILKSG